jgi:hypothetical protein
LLLFLFSGEKLSKDDCDLDGRYCSNDLCGALLKRKETGRFRMKGTGRLFPPPTLRLYSFDESLNVLGLRWARTTTCGVLLKKERDWTFSHEGKRTIVSAGDAETVQF